MKQLLIIFSIIFLTCSSNATIGQSIDYDMKSFCEKMIIDLNMVIDLTETQKEEIKLIYYNAYIDLHWAMLAVDKSNPAEVQKVIKVFKKDANLKILSHVLTRQQAVVLLDAIKAERSSIE